MAAGSRVGGAQYPEVASAPYLNRLVRWLASERRTSRLANCVGEGEQVILGRKQGGRVMSEPNYLPPARRAESLGMNFAEVVGMRLGIGCERA